MFLRSAVIKSTAAVLIGRFDEAGYCMGLVL